MTQTAMDIDARPLPTGWKWVKLGDICQEDRTTVAGNSDVAKGLPYLSLEHIESGSGKILIEPQDVPEDSGRSNTFAFDERHILYGKLRPYLNKVAMPEYSGRCTTEAIPLLPTDSDRGYVAWFLRREETVAYSMREKTGSRMPRADVKDLLRMPVPLPPLEEQKRITAVLNEQMAAVEKAKKAAEERLEAAKALPSAFLREVIPFEDDELPDGWERVRLGDICEVVTGNTPSKAKPHYYGGNIPWVGPALLGINHFVETSEVCLTDEGLTQARLVPPGSVLISCISSVAQVGKASIAGCSLTTNQQINTLIPSGDIDSVFLLHTTKTIKQKLVSIGRQSVNQFIVNKSQLSDISIAVPPLEQQHQIASDLDGKLSGVTLAQESIQQELETIEAMPSSLLRKAFSGEL